MWLKEMFICFLSLALGYILCVIAKKQTSVLKTTGYTLGVGIIALTFLAALGTSYYGQGKPCGMGDKMGKCACMMKHHR